MSYANIVMNVKDGFFCGFALSLAFFLRGTAKVNQVIRRYRENQTTLTAEELQSLKTKNIHIIQYNNPLYFATASEFRRLFKMDHYHVKHVIVDCNCINNMDYDGVQAIIESVQEMKARSIESYWVNGGPGVKKILQRAGLIDMLGDRVNITLDQALQQIATFEDERLESGNRQSTEGSGLVGYQYDSRTKAGYTPEKTTQV